MPGKVSTEMKTTLPEGAQAAAMNSGFWISLMFFGQAVCAVVFSRMVHISRAEIFLPVLVLFAGGVVSALAHVLNGRRGGGSGWRWLIPAFFYGLFITLMSNRSFSGVQVSFDTSYFHPVEYATLGLLLGKFWYRVIEQKGFGSFALRVFLAVGLFGIADELHQWFVPGRDADIKDWAFDLAGALAAILIVAVIRRFTAPGVKTFQEPAE
jgi:hypothetical protein